MARPMKKGSDTDHFNTRVPEALRNALLAAAEAIKEDFIGDPYKQHAWVEPYGTADISAIYGYHISGFIPSQMGGYEISELYHSDTDASYHFTAAQTESMNATQEHCYSCFLSDNSEALHPFMTPEEIEAKALTYGAIEKAGLESEFSDYENEFFEPALLRVEMWIDDPENKRHFGLDDKATPSTVLIQVGLNYRDQPYYRAKSDELLFELKFSAEAFMAASPAVIVAALKEKMEGVA